jgi:hypothetical protein
VVTVPNFGKLRGITPAGAAMISPELNCLSALRGARAWLFGEIEAHAAAHVGLGSVAELDRDHRKLLRGEPVAQIAEFFYVLRDGGVSVPDGLRAFLLRHNEDMAALLASCRNGYSVGGLSEQRIKRSMFSDAQINYVLHESSNGQIRFDQQALQRIFTQTMSFESCRTLLVLLADFGFLHRWEFNQVIIASNGRLEDLFAEHLTHVVNALGKSP